MINLVSKTKSPRKIDVQANVCFVGIGVLLTNCYAQVVQAVGCEPEYLYDNSEAKWGEYFWGKKCISAAELNTLDKSTVIIICVRSFGTLTKQFLDLGFSNIFVVLFERGFDRIRAIEAASDLSLSISAKVEDLQLDISGKWALVTGSSRGIGLIIATELSKLGANIILHGRKKDNTANVEEQCRSSGVQCLSYGADLSSMGELEGFAGWLQKEAPPIDILYNNAGISIPSPDGFWGMPATDFSKSFITNTVSAIRLSQVVIPGMRKRGFGRVVFASSSIQARPGEMAYACSKAAIDKFVFDLCPSLEGSGVMLSILDPGWVKSDMGGADATHALETVVPGVLIGAVANGNVNGKWITVQDYARMELLEALQKAFAIEDFLRNEC